MYEFLIDEDNNNPIVVDLFNQLRANVKLVSKKDGVDYFNRTELLDEAMRCNPQRIIDYEKMMIEKKQLEKAYLKEHGEIDRSKLGVGCEKENCCQRLGKNNEQK